MESDIVRELLLLRAGGFVMVKLWMGSLVSSLVSLTCGEVKEARALRLPSSVHHDWAKAHRTSWCVSEHVIT